jgi:tetratricopeptide (TPR) repeat protein
MNTNTVTGRALFALFIIAFICIPVSAYSADATTLFNTGRNLTISGNYTAAVIAYNNAITLEPAYFEAWNGKADALNRNAQFTDALAASNRSLEINPDYVNGWINRGQILYNIGYENEDVVHDMEKANALYAEQLRAFEKAVSLDPNNAEAWFNRGYALAGMKRYDEAIDAFDRVKVIDPSYPNLQKNREIAVQLRDKSPSPIMTTEPTGHETGNAAKTTAPSKPSETVAQRPSSTPAQPAPFPAETGIIAIMGAIFLILQRK